MAIGFQTQLISGRVPEHEPPTVRDRSDIKGVVVHRIEVSQEDGAYTDSPHDTARFFTEHPIGIQATGGSMPYPLLIDRDGQVTQMVPLAYVTPHAKSHNPSTVGVACIGDFRTTPLSPAQRQALKMVCAQLLAVFDLETDTLRGHDELTEASSDPNKECPGHCLSMDGLRGEVKEIVVDQARNMFPLVWNKGDPLQ